MSIICNFRDRLVVCFVICQLVYSVCRLVYTWRDNYVALNIFGTNFMPFISRRESYESYNSHVSLVLN